MFFGSNKLKMNNMNNNLPSAMIEALQKYIKKHTNMKRMFVQWKCGNVLLMLLSP